MNYRTVVYERYAEVTTAGAEVCTDAVYQRWAAACRHRLRGWLPPDRQASCLDIGCGRGNVLYMLKEAGYVNIHGVDLSREQVALAREMGFDVADGDAVAFLQANLNRFDLITGFDVIEHFRKDELFQLLDAIYQALRPGGRVILQTPNAESPWGHSIRYGDLTHEVAFNPASLSHALRLAGFERFEARECGPYVRGLPSLGRAALWWGIRLALALWNLAETGSRGSGIYTRVFVATALKPR